MGKNLFCIINKSNIIQSVFFLGKSELKTHMRKFKSNDWFCGSSNNNEQRRYQDPQENLNKVNRLMRELEIQVKFLIFF